MSAINTTKNCSHHDCSICLEPITQTTSNKSGKALSLRCSHVFHRDCINHWLKINAVCPLCRTPSTTRVHSQPLSIGEAIERHPLINPEVPIFQSLRIGTWMQALWDRSIRNGLS